MLEWLVAHQPLVLDELPVLALPELGAYGLPNHNYHGGDYTPAYIADLNY